MKKIGPHEMHLVRKLLFESDDILIKGLDRTALCTVIGVMQKSDKYNAAKEMHFGVSPDAVCIKIPFEGEEKTQKIYISDSNKPPSDDSLFWVTTKFPLLREAVNAPDYTSTNLEYIRETFPTRQSVENDFLRITFAPKRFKIQIKTDYLLYNKLFRYAIPPKLTLTSEYNTEFHISVPGILPHISRNSEIPNIRKPVVFVCAGNFNSLRSLEYGNNNALIDDIVQFLSSMDMKPENWVTDAKAFPWYAKEGVCYFPIDDNRYRIRLFDDVRKKWWNRIKYQILPEAEPVDFQHLLLSVPHIYSGIDIPFFLLDTKSFRSNTCLRVTETGKEYPNQKYVPYDEIKDLSIKVRDDIVNFQDPAVFTSSVLKNKEVLYEAGRIFGSLWPALIKDSLVYGTYTPAYSIDEAREKARSF